MKCSDARTPGTAEQKSATKQAKAEELARKLRDNLRRRKQPPDKNGGDA